jgi:purine-binding chemotaxis protein CheW
MKESSTSRQLVAFYLHDHLYAVPIHAVKGIIRMDRVTRVPFSEPCLEGMVNLRGSLLTVINGSRWLGRVSHAPAEKILVIQKKKSIIGFAVDQVDGVITVAPEDVLSPEEGSLEQYEGFVMREGTVIRILKVEAVLKPLQNESRPVMPSALSTAVHSLFEPEWSEPRSAAILRFEISGECYGLPMEKVREIAPFPEQLEPIQGLPDCILGLGVFRGGRMLPIVEASHLTHGHHRERLSRVIVVELPAGNGSIQLGLAVEHVHEVRMMKQASPLEIPASLKRLSDGIEKVYSIDGLTKPLFLLDVQQVLEKLAVLPYLLSESAGGEGAGADFTEEDASSQGEELILFFRLNGEEFGISSARVKEITRMSPVRKVPFASVGVAGLANIRGQLVTVLDAQDWLMQESSRDPFEHLIVMQGHRTAKCIGVHEVTRVLPVAADKIQRAGMYEQSTQFGWLRGFYKESDTRLIPLIDPSTWE